MKKLSEKYNPQKVQEAIQAAYDTGEDVWSSLVEEYDEDGVATEPRPSLEPPKFTVKQCAQMLGKKESALRTAEARGTIPPFKEAVRGNRTVKYAEPADLELIRRRMKIEPSVKIGQKGVVTLVLSPKGGVGKSTTAINLAIRCAMEGLSVCAVELDPQGSLTTVLGYVAERDIDPEQTLAEYMGYETEEHPKPIKTRWSNLDLIPGSQALASMEIDMISSVVEKHMKGEDATFYNRMCPVTEQLASDYDVVIIDSPPTLGMISTTAMYAANIVINPITPTMLSVASSQQSLDSILRSMKTSKMENIRAFKTFFNNYAADHPLTREMLRAIQKAYSPLMMLTSVPSSKAISTAQVDLMSVYEMNREQISSARTHNRCIDLLDEQFKEFASLLEDVSAVLNEEA